MSDKIKELQEDIEELSIQLSDMLCVALRLSGVKIEHLEEACDVYLEELEAYDEEYGQEEILQILQKVKKAKPNFFKV